MRSLTRVPLVAVASAVAPVERRIITPVKSASVGLVQCSATEVSVDDSARTFRPVTAPGAATSLATVSPAQPAAARESINREHDRPARTRNLLTVNSLANTHDATRPPTAHAHRGRAPHDGSPEPSVRRFREVRVAAP